MEIRTPGRPKKKNNGVRMSVYVEREIYDYLMEKAGAGRMSEFVEEALRFVIRGHEEVIDLKGQFESLKSRFKLLQEEKVRLEKENEHLRKRLTKLEAELEKWRAKWDGQKTLDRWTRRNTELMNLVEFVSEYLEEGKTWREVLEKAGILTVADRMDILHKLFTELQLGRSKLLFSRYLRGWILEPNGLRGGYDKYVLRHVESLPDYERERILKLVGVEA